MPQDLWNASLTWPTTGPWEAVDQQSFLGASIRGFHAQGGFGTTSSELTVELVVDEFFQSDRTGLGAGVDVYHNGVRDNFRPPPAGSPVFFTFGKKRASINDAFKHVIDNIYGTSDSQGTTPGHYNFSYGGILQSYIETRGTAGNPLYTAKVVDPREILSTVQVILNNYSGPVYGQYNIINVYGYLESINSQSEARKNGGNPITRTDNPTTGQYQITGTDMWPSANASDPKQWYGFRFSGIGSNASQYSAGSQSLAPITGIGFSRRSKLGMPYHRISTGLNSLFGHYGGLPADIRGKYFEGINFRGLNYLVDLTGLPLINAYYYMDFDQINLLDFCLEICDIANHDLYVELLPIIAHSAFNHLGSPSPTSPAAVIRCSTISRKNPFNLSAIKNYIDTFPSDKIIATDVGYELSNSVNDKFLVGANEVDMYYIDTSSDRNFQQDNGEQWKHNVMLDQNVIPYYGMLHNQAVTIPRGVNSYQQIKLDTTGLFANGVGNYYVATEMELRAALVSYECWVNFLMQYNDLFMEKVQDNNIGDEGTPQVTVPCCVFPPITGENNFSGGEPKNPCNPPYGYPLYYHRATMLGVPQAGLVGAVGLNRRLLTTLGNIRRSTKEDLKETTSAMWDYLSSVDTSRLSRSEKAFYDRVSNAVKNGTFMAVIDDCINQCNSIVANSANQYKENMKNVMKVYNFLKGVASDCLGKKFLVQIPQEKNQSYSATTINTLSGPYGFPNNSKINPLNVNYNPIAKRYEYNYYPEPQGGYYSYETSEFHGTNKLIQYGLAPSDETYLLLENGRIPCYVRFNGSHTLSFEQLSKDSYTQQKKAGTTSWIPDYTYAMENTSANRHNLSNALSGHSSAIDPSIAFVRCTIDEKLYMPPQKTQRSVGCFSYSNYSSYSASHKPKKDYDRKTGRDVDTYTSTQIYYPIRSLSGSASVWDFDFDYLFDGTTPKSDPQKFKYDTDHVYALITLPNRVVPSVQTRWRDIKELSSHSLKHQLLLDTVVNVDSCFSSFTGTARTKYKSVTKTDEEIKSDNEFDAAVKKSMEGMTFAHSNKIRFVSPSPVYPDLVALPLRSTERCYGPWASAYVTTDIIGGHIEFVKNENLAPWNYTGYKYMDDAGRNIAELSSTSQMTSERGSITIADAPSGITLASELSARGPLVTSVSVDVDATAGVKTVYRMDLFTASFGKLQKQKEDQIDKISRNKQKLDDERNALIRKGFGKNATDVRYNEVYKDMRNFRADATRTEGTMAENGMPASQTLVASVLDINDGGSSYKDGETNTASAGGAGATRKIDAAMPNNEHFQTAGENLGSYPALYAKQYWNSASANLTDIRTPASLEPNHNNMPSHYPRSNTANNADYGDALDNTELTFWRN